MAELGGEGTSSGPVSFADLGIPETPKLQDTFLGKARQFKDVNLKERVYVFLSLFSLLATFIFTLYKISTVGAKDPDFTFALVLLVNTLFCMYYVIWGILQERATEILVLCVATIIVLIYLIVNYATGKQDTVKLVRMIVACVLCPFLIATGFRLSFEYYQSGNLIFRTVGASTDMQNKCRLIFTFFDLLKFDLQLAISMVIFILTNRDNLDTEDIVVLSVGGVVTIVWFLLGYDAMKRENECGAVLFLLLSPLQVAYVIYKLVQTADCLGKEECTGLAGTTIACGALSLVIRILVFVMALFVMKNFKTGLKQKAFGIGPPITITESESRPSQVPEDQSSEFVP